MRVKKSYPLRYTARGYVFISEKDNLDLLVDALLYNDYPEEFCLSLNFESDFVASLMYTGFLVMSSAFEDEPDDYILLPKLHLERSVLFFQDLHIKKSIKHLLNRYELKVDTDFEFIVNRCVEAHGNEWLTDMLLENIFKIHSTPESSLVKPISFGVYRNGKLAAGEFGVLAGSVYTSYSGYYDEDNAGTVQMILMARYLEEHGSPFLDLGMPLPYKYELGAKDITPDRFVELFRKGREMKFKIFP
jgi:Leu/Phe-tRNA-protein transferase